MKKERVIFDTNIFVRALVGSAANKKLYKLFKEGVIEIVLSEEMFKEVTSVLYRPKLGLDEREIKYCLYLIRKQATIIEPKTKINMSRDPKDNIFIETAITAKVKYIVTSDKDILEIPPDKLAPIKAINPKEFLNILSGLSA